MCLVCLFAYWVSGMREWGHTVSGHSTSLVVCTSICIYLNLLLVSVMFDRSTKCLDKVQVTEFIFGLDVH